MLSHEDFTLTRDELEAINRIISDAAANLNRAGEDPSDGVMVTFGFSPFGRSLGVCVNGASWVPLS
jgi:hypothetical protein